MHWAVRWRSPEPGTCGGTRSTPTLHSAPQEHPYPPPRTPRLGLEADTRGDMKPQLLPSWRPPPHGAAQRPPHPPDPRAPAGPPWQHLRSAEGPQWPPRTPQPWGQPSAPRRLRRTKVLKDSPVGLASARCTGVPGPCGLPATALNPCGSLRRDSAWPQHSLDWTRRPGDDRTVTDGPRLPRASVHTPRSSSPPPRDAGLKVMGINVLVTVTCRGPCCGREPDK